METRRNNRDTAKTKYIRLETARCEACWKCIEVCPNNVFGRVNLRWHKHARIIKSDNCIGCLKCIKACEHKALSKVSANSNIVETREKTPHFRFIINIALLFTGVFTVSSGFLLQFCYHIGQNGNIDFNKLVFSVNYLGWSNIHKMSILLLSVFMAFHIVQHRAWYKAIIKKNLIAKNRQVLILSTVFVFVAITGYIPWIIDLKGNDQYVRRFFIEIHDKLAIIFSVFLILHVAKRFNWFLTTLKRIMNINHV